MSEINSERRCFIEECENRTSLDFEPPWLENVIPWKDENMFVRQCQRYNETQFDSDQCQSNATDADSFQECQEWVYETSIFHSTLVTEVSTFTHSSSSSIIYLR